MDQRARIVEAARSFIGVPFYHCGRSREGGIDCFGHVLAVAQAMGYKLRDTPSRPYSTVVTDIYSRYLDKFMVKLPRDEILPGDIAFITFNTAYGTHTTFMTEQRTIVHASAVAMKVLEMPYDGAPYDNTVCGYRFKELA